MIFTFLTLLFISCSTTGKYQAKSSQIHNNMEAEKVLSIMGQPGNRQFNGNYEAWQYFDLGFNTDVYIVIWFHNKRVYSVTSYSETDGGIEPKFREISWNNIDEKGSKIDN